MSDQFALPKLSLGLLTAAAMLLIFAWRPAPAFRRWSTAPAAPLLALTFFGAMGMATALADAPRQSVLGTYTDYSGWLSYAPGVACFLAASAVVRTPRGLERVVSWVSIGAVPAVAYGLLQQVGWDPVDWDLTFGGRPFSTLGQPLVLGGYLAVLLPAVLWLALRRRGGERWFLFAQAAAMFALLMFTETRGAYFGIAAAAVFGGAWLLHARMGLRGVAIAAGAVVLAGSVAAVAFALDAMPDRLRSTETLDERTHLWRASVDMVGDRPLLGWGPDQFAVNYGRYRVSAERGTQSAYEPPAATPHNEPLTIAVGGGVVGAGAYVLLWGAVALAALRSGARGRRRDAMRWTTAALLAYAVQAQFSIPDVALSMIAMTLLGSLAGMAGVRRQHSRARIRGMTWVRAAAAGAGVALSLVAAAIVAADVVNERGEDALAAGSSASLDRFKLAARINPLQAEYADDVAVARAASPRWGVPAREANDRSLDAWERRIARFGGEARHHLLAARAATLAGGGESTDAMEFHLREAERLDPENPGMAAAVAEIRTLADGR